MSTVSFNLGRQQLILKLKKDKNHVLIQENKTYSFFFLILLFFIIIYTLFITEEIAIIIIIIVVTKRTIK